MEIVEIRSPVRATHTYTQTLDGTPGEVLPLLCPVREVEWVPGWAPRLVLSDSGLAEPDCVFTTPDPASDTGAEAIWTVLSQDPARDTVEMLKVTPGFLVVRLAIALRARPEGGCYADVTYRYTALGAAGEAYVRERTASVYTQFMRDWETALNGYLRAKRQGKRASQVICSAIASHRLLSFSYEGFERVVEPHRCGRNTAGHDVLLAWLVRGHSESGAGPGWRAYLLTEMRDIRALDESFASARPGYTTSDSSMQMVYCELPPGSR